jgi:cellulose synthase/poly-beta-1,6-N-acetylglucosamine synthase-like glycosyltransferase
LISLLWLLFILYGSIVVLWLWGVRWIRSLQSDQLFQIEPRPGEAWAAAAPSLSVYIAAHNEQARIDRCLRHILAQNYPNLRVVVVNDRSDDDTSGRVRRVMTDDPRVDLVEVRHLPEGWIGKTHALAEATRSADCDYLLFVDCDCRLAPGAISAVMRKVVGEDLQFVSLWPRLELLSLSERLLTPATSWLLGLWAILGTKRGAPNSEVTLGNGQFMLFSRAAYARIGGHGSVRAELAEDAVIAQQVADLGLRRWMGLGQGLYVTSRQNSFSNTFNSLTRVLIGSLVRPWRLLMSVHLLMGGVVLPLWLFPLSLHLGLRSASTVWAAFAVASLLHFLAILYVIRGVFTMTLEDRPSVLSFFVGSLLNVGVLIWAWLVITGRAHVRWGKTSYLVRGSRIVGVVPGTG